MKKNSYNFFIGLISLIIILNFFSCQNNKQGDAYKLVARDTIRFPNVSFSRIHSYQIEGNLYKVFVNDREAQTAYLYTLKDNLIIDSLKFPYQKAMADNPNISNSAARFIYLYDKTHIFSLCIEKKPNVSGVLYSAILIDTNGNWVRKRFDNKIGDNYYFHTPLIPFPITIKNNKRTYIVAYFPRNKLYESEFNDYALNTNSRISVFSMPPTFLLSFKDSSAQIAKYFGSYPKILIDTTHYFYNYFPTFAPANNSILYLYSGLDTIYEIDKKNKMIKHPFHSRFLTKRTVFDKEQYFNYAYIRKWACENQSNMRLYYDNNNKRTYLIVKIARNYVNEDGTVNKASDNPFSVLVLDSLFHKVSETKIDEEYGKHQSFVTSEGIWLHNKMLSDLEGYPVFVLFSQHLNE